MLRGLHGLVGKLDILRFALGNFHTKIYQGRGNRYFLLNNTMPKVGFFNGLLVLVLHLVR